MSREAHVRIYERRGCNPPATHPTCPQGHGTPARELETAAALIAFYTGCGQASPAIVGHAKPAGRQLERAG